MGWVLLLLLSQTACISIAHVSDMLHDSAVVADSTAFWKIRAMASRMNGQADPTAGHDAWQQAEDFLQV